MLFVSVELVKKLIERTKTKTGSTVTVDIIAGNYPTGAKAPPGFKENMTILFDDHLPKWNYRVIPSTWSLDLRRFSSRKHTARQFSESGQLLDFHSLTPPGAGCHGRMSSTAIWLPCRPSITTGTC